MRSIFIFTLLLPLQFFAQLAKIESKLHVSHSTSADSTTVNKLNDLAWERKDNPDSAIYYSNIALDMAKQIKWTKGIGETYHQLGILYLAKGEYNISIQKYTKALAIWDYMAKKTSALTSKFIFTKRAKTLGNLGNVYANQGLYIKAIEHFLMALKINETLNNLKLQAVNLGNLGIIYKKQKNYAKALLYYFKSLQITHGSEYLQTYANTLGNIGLVYSEMKNFSSALTYYLKALALAKQNHFSVLQENTLGNIGLVYAKQNQFSKAINYNLEALDIAVKIDDKIGEAYISNNVGQFYFELRNYEKSKSYLQNALLLSSEIGDLSTQSNVYLNLSKLFEKTGNGILAYNNLQKYIEFKDSIENEENMKAQSQLEAKFEYDRKAAADSVGFEKQKEIKNVEIENQKLEIKAKRNQQYLLFGGLALVLIFAAFMFNRFKVTQKQKQIIEIKEEETQKQKQIIEEKASELSARHKEITDSINYAERIQRSFLATKHLLDEHLKDYFVFFKPKDVVSGDFYWGCSTPLSFGDGSGVRFVLVTADSTGHGVPGAIMSLLNIMSIEKAIERTYNPAEILNAARDTIIERLKKDGSADGGKDGMDCSVISVDRENQKLQVAAANNPIWIIRKKTIEESVALTIDNVEKQVYELIEIKADKMPVGKNDKDKQPFTLHTLDVNAGDIVFTLTDGFADQFGGEKSKKFMSKNLKELLLKNAGLPMHDQKILLETSFQNWMGNLEQVDDVTVIGIRI